MLWSIWVVMLLKNQVPFHTFRDFFVLNKAQFKTKQTLQIGSYRKVCCLVFLTKDYIDCVADMTGGKLSACMWEFAFTFPPSLSAPGLLLWFSQRKPGSHWRLLLLLLPIIPSPCHMIPQLSIPLPSFPSTSPLLVSQIWISRTIPIPLEAGEI